MDHRCEARVGFVVTSGDAAELLDLAEEVLDQMTPLVHLEVAGDCGDPIGFGRDRGNRAPVVQLGAEPVAVEGFVRQQGSEVEIRQKRGDTHAVVREHQKLWEVAQAAAANGTGWTSLAGMAGYQVVNRSRSVPSRVQVRVCRSR